MAQEILNDGDTGLQFRTKCNDNFTELFETAETFVSASRVTPETFSLTTTPINIPFADTVAYANGMTYNPTTGAFTNVVAGIYSFDFFMSANWDNGDELLLSAWVDAVPVGNSISLTGLGTSKNIALGVPIFLNLQANQTIELKGQVETGTASLEVVSGAITLSLKVAT